MVEKPKKKKKKQIKVFEKPPSGHELRDIAELTEVIEDLGMMADASMLKRAIVNDSVPEYVY